MTTIVLFILLATSSRAQQTNIATSTNKFFPEPVYVSLQKTGAVERFPDGKVFKGFPGAHYLSVGPNGNILAISGFKTGQVYIADARTGKKEVTLKIGKVVQGVKIDPRGKYALAVNASGGAVAVIDLDKKRVVKSIPVGRIPHNVRFTSNGRLAYVTVQGEDKIAVLDMNTLKKVKEIPISGLKWPHNLDISADGRRLWIRNHPPKANDTGHVAMMNLASGQVRSSLAVGKFHGGIDLESPGSDVLTTNIGGNTVDVIDPNGLTIIKSITVGAGPHGVRYGPKGKWAYVSATRGNEVDVINMKTLKVAKRIKTKGTFPFWIALQGNE